VPALDGIWLARPETPARGKPVAVKDLIDTAALPTTYGSSMFLEHVPANDAAAVALLTREGFAVAGKTNLHEFAYGVSSQNEHFGTVPNPRYPGLLAGGSSGGSAAAIASGEVELALGTDSGGSIRIPAAWCGIVGFKPTFGLVPADGVFPLAPSYDHVGPMASTVGGCIELMRALAPALAPGLEPGTVESLEELRVGIAWLDDAEPGVRTRVAAAAARFPRSIRVELPFPEGAENALFMREVADVHGGLFPERADEYGESIRRKLERCNAVTDDEVAEAERLRAAYRERCDDALGDLDLLVTPTVLWGPPPADADEAALRARTIRCTYPFDSLGWPALALPCAPTDDGLPASVQLVGRAGADATVLGAGLLLASLV
jgi:aspartyl-tRNA(Asn)/glutamyl-tRNA(Gln) amidotransferase subunit A